MVTLQGGSNRYAYDAAHGFIEAKVTVTLKENPSWIYSLMLGATPTNLTKEKTGVVRNFQNKKGTSIISSTTFKSGDDGIIVTDGQKGQLKFGTYTIVVDSANKLNIYISSDVDGARGTAIVLQDDFLRVNTEALTPADDLTVDNLGITFKTVDSGFDAATFKPGDSATFEIIPEVDYFREVVIGRNTDTFPAFGLYCISENIQASSLTLIDCYKCKANGLPQAFAEKAWAESELSIMALIDGQNGVAKITDLIRN